MTTIAFRAEAVVLDEAVAVERDVLVEEGRVHSVVRRGAGDVDRVVPLEGVLMPGGVDLQVNGAGGRSVDEATPEALDAVAVAVERGGAAAFLPTLITAPFDRLLDQVAAVARWIDERPAGAPGAVPLGLHLEGPFLEEPGAHDARHFRDPDPSLVQALLEAGQDRVALVTLACSRPGAVEATARLTGAGVAVAIGHARSVEGFEGCVAAGARLVTHLFNAMGPVHHRAPGIAGLALDTPELACPMLVDGAHVHPAMVRNAFRILGTDRTVLVTDAMPAAGMADGEYAFGTIRARVVDGVARDAEGRLAGSALTLSLAARRFAEMVPGVGPWTLAQILARNPARCLDEPRWGRIATGAPAMFGLWNGEELRVVRP